MLRSKSLFFAVALLLFASVASAQQQPRGGGRGGFGGPFGGMFNSPVGLLRMPEVQKELNLSDEQTKEVDESLAQIGPGRGGFNFQELQNLSDEERQKRMEEMRAKAEEATKAAEEKMNKILKPEQLARLKQLNLQRQGAMALSRPDVAKDLGLTQEQQDKLRDIQASTRQAGGGGGRNFQDLSDEERQKLFTEMRERQEKAQADMLAVLTPDQKTKFAELKGKDFTFPQGGFGGAGGGGGNRGERRRPPTKE
jgi:Spy/CpxP family protein refolding chaperone